jgi:diguanylate cyclase (GGDEF)-like protein
VYINKNELQFLNKCDFEDLTNKELLELKDELIDIVMELDKQQSEVQKDFEHIKKQLQINEVVLHTQKQMTEQLLEQVRQLSITDALTGLYNRRYFNEISYKELSRCIRQKEYFTLVIFDVDYFKQYNDYYGHQKGDEALQTLAQLLKDKLLRGCDYVFRLGGEEFGFIFEDLNVQESIEFCQTIRKSIENLKIEHKNSPTSQYLTASFGLVCCIPNQSMSVDVLYNVADEQLYVAKNSGRNQVSSTNLQ